MKKKPDTRKVPIYVSTHTRARLARMSGEENYECIIQQLVAAEEHRSRPQCAPPAPPTRVRILNQGAALTTGERNKAYGDPVVNMQHMAGLLTAYFHNLLCANDNGCGMNHYCFTGEDAAQIMVMAKLSRTANRGVPYHEDNYTDAATYSAMAGECAEKER